MADPGDIADRAHMRRAVALGRQAMGAVWPNPPVGCVIVRDDEVLGEAATAPGGRPHAEEQALAQAGGAARGATAFITLEPCSRRSNHKTSCTGRLLASGVARVVVASPDVSSNASGRGLKRLQRAGVRVEIGLLAEAAEPLAAGFHHRLATGRPLVEAADDGDGFDAAFEPAAGEALHTALMRYGRDGYTRLWTSRGGALAWELARQGLLAGQATEGPSHGRNALIRPGA